MASTNPEQTTPVAKRDPPPKVIGAQRETERSETAKQQRAKTEHADPMPDRPIR